MSDYDNLDGLNWTTMNIRIPQDLKERATKIAKLNGTSLSGMIRESLKWIAVSQRLDGQIIDGLPLMKKIDIALRGLFSNHPHRRITDRVDSGLFAFFPC